MSDLYGVYGASGCGRGVLPLLRQQLADRQGSNAELVFIDDASETRIINGHRVQTFDEFYTVPAERKSVVLAIANGVVRAALAKRLADHGISAFDRVCASNVVIMDEVEIGEGAVLSPFVTLTSNIKIGRFFHANLYSYVEHDCVIGDFVTFAPGVKCNGNIVVEDFAYIGAGAVIRQGKPGAPLTIGRGATVGMGAVVTKSVPPGATVIGNPARIMSQTHA
jgi:sugar O-acyltransferase (sialic acid O-acetyltransferase NeuD family)